MSRLRSRRFRRRLPELALWLEGQRQTLAQDLEGRGVSLGELGAEITGLRDALEDSRGQLVDVSASLEKDLARVKQQGAISSKLSAGYAPPSSRRARWSLR